MNKRSLHKTAQRVFDLLPPDFQRVFISHAHDDDPDDFLGELIIAWLEGRTPAQARSAARRFSEGGQAPRAIASLDAWMERHGHEDKNHGLEMVFIEEEEEEEKKEINLDGFILDSKELATRLGVTRRRAQQIIKQQVDRAKELGDLFITSLPSLEEGEGGSPPEAGGRGGR
ncbi:MAG: hypothetical protein K6360_09325, partial [Deltaproteobacteria bacterium]